MSITPDGKNTISGSWDKTLNVWDIESGQCLKKLEGHMDLVRSVSITPDGKKAVSGSGGITYPKGIDIDIPFSGSADNTLRVWDIESGQCLKRLEGHTYPVESVSITSNGEKAVSGSGDETLRVWDIKSGQCLKELEGHTGAVICVSITPDGKTAVSGSVDMTVRVWDIESGQCLKKLEGHTHLIENVSITLDGKKALSVSGDGTLRVWDIESGENIAIYLSRSGLSSVSEIRASGQFACGTTTGEVIILKFHNVFINYPIVTPLRLWLYNKLFDSLIMPLGRKTCNGLWDDDIKASCLWCGQPFTVSDEILNMITVINRNANLSPAQCPCLELPSEAWDDPQLISECPHCHKPLRFNPFIVDNKEKDTKENKDTYEESILILEKHLKELKNTFSIVPLCWLILSIVDLAFFKGGWLEGILKAPVDGLLFTFPILCIQSLHFLHPKLKFVDLMFSLFLMLVIPFIITISPFVFSPIDNLWTSVFGLNLLTLKATLSAKGIIVLAASLISLVSSLIKGESRQRIKRRSQKLVIFFLLSPAIFSWLVLVVLQLLFFKYALQYLVKNTTGKKPYDTKK